MELGYTLATVRPAVIIVVKVVLLIESWHIVRNAVLSLSIHASWTLITRTEITRTIVLRTFRHCVQIAIALKRHEMAIT
jgi:hypothetical protein